MQSIQNVDFGVEVRFQSAVQLGNQDEGIIVEQDDADYVRFDILSDGTQVYLFAAALNGGNATTFLNTPIPARNAPIWLRLQRSGSNWTGTWSTDGSNFNAGANFSYALNVSQIGPYAGTYSDGDTPAFTAVVDYFFNTASPLSDQHGPAPFDMITVDNDPGAGLVEKTLANIQGIPGRLNPVVGFESPSGGLYWYAPRASGNLNDADAGWTKNTIVADGNAYEDMLAYDVNGDGAVDIVASYQPPQSATGLVWFENPLGH
jgi:hypothetical protein